MSIADHWICRMAPLKATSSGAGVSSSASTRSKRTSSKPAKLPAEVEVFDGDWEVFEARRPALAKAKPVRDCADALRFTKHPTRSGYYISTPNVEFIPQLPTKTAKVQYYEDGMLGALEFFKWPQEQDDKCPFAVAAPGNELLLSFPAQSFPVVDSGSVLPQFADVDAPWFHIRGRNFETSAVFPTGHYGRLHEDVLNRLEAAVLEIIGMVEKSVVEAAVRLQELAVVERDHELDVERERRGVQERHTACEKLQTRMQQSWMKLYAGNLTPFETMLVFCEVQRMLLALRGWVIYTDILWPRLMTPHADFRFSPLPLRGVFSEDSEFVKEMYRIGVPVWYIRPTITFWKGTAIIQSTPFIPARAAFSTTTVMRLGQFNLNAPASASGG
ncbi:hypothetical protein EUX98_g7984, partial [Antrodiella citrinella]